MSSHTKMHSDTEFNMVHPTLGYVHNCWLLYYSLCNHIRLVHYAYNRYSMISLSILTILFVVKSSLCNLSLDLRHRLSLILIIFSQSLPSSNNFSSALAAYSTQPITYLYIEFRSQNPIHISPRPYDNS